MQLLHQSLNTGRIHWMHINYVLQFFKAFLKYFAQFFFLILDMVHYFGQAISQMQS